MRLGFNWKWIKAKYKAFLKMSKGRFKKQEERKSK